MPVPKGQRFGGRQKGTKNKVTLARAAAQAEVARQNNQKLGLDVMTEIMNFFAGLGAKYQPVYEDREVRDEKTGEVRKVKVLIGGDEKKCANYLKMAADIAKDVTQYQSPKLQSTTFRPAGDSNQFVHRVEVEFV